MKNQLVDLNNHLFAQLERLGDESLQGEGLSTEIQRAKAMANVGRQVIDNARLALDAYRLEKEYGGKGEAPKMLGLDTGKV